MIVEAFRIMLQEIYREIGKSWREMTNARVAMAHALTDMTDARIELARWQIDFYEEQATELKLLQTLLSGAKKTDGGADVASGS